jgi:hypothetical protein
VSADSGPCGCAHAFACFDRFSWLVCSSTPNEAALPPVALPAAHVQTQALPASNRSDPASTELQRVFQALQQFPI